LRSLRSLGCLPSCVSGLHPVTMRHDKRFRRAFGPPTPMCQPSGIGRLFYHLPRCRFRSPEVGFIWGPWLTESTKSLGCLKASSPSGDIAVVRGSRCHTSSKWVGQAWQGCPGNRASACQPVVVASLLPQIADPSPCLTAW